MLQLRKQKALENDFDRCLLIK